MTSNPDLLAKWALRISVAALFAPILYGVFAYDYLQNSFKEAEEKAQSLRASGKCEKIEWQRAKATIFIENTGRLPIEGVSVALSQQFWTEGVAGNIEQSVTANPPTEMTFNSENWNTFINFIRPLPPRQKISITLDLQLHRSTCISTWVSSNDSPPVPIAWELLNFNGNPK